MDKKIKILIVDDNIDTVELLKKRLHTEGYTTVEAFDGEECLSQVDACNPDLIVLDLMMPKLNGLEVCQRLKSEENTRYIPIIMLTAKGEVEDRVKGLETGADDYLAKPFDYKELSARVRSLLAMKESREKLAEEEKSEALGQMIDEVAHEVRNPLVSIGGFARRVYQNLPAGNPNRKYMEMIIEDVARIENMVRQLVELQTSSISYLESVDINEIITNVLRLFDREFEEKAIDVDTELMENAPVMRADREQMGKAIANLVKNAIEAMDGDTRVLKVTTGTGEGRMEIRISDTGKGISRDKLKNIFDPLYTSKIYGPGLGLTFTLKIIEEHRGTISVESEQGKGTSVTVRLPLKKG
ncbi:MAG: response regulator [Nitrospiraceae bacterium]|nr:response regulator [Nitrospiraceae bacterium]